VFKRDKWTCGICHEAIDRTLRWPDLMSASVDHVIPLAEGGSHTYDNVQAAHWLCNTYKRDSAGFTLAIPVTEAA
jgi:5-methylcytosine-specific restriction endonuclease McrA